MIIKFIKHLDGLRYAIVIESGSQITGGVALMSNWEIEWRAHDPRFIFGAAISGGLSMKFVWEWFEVFGNVDDFVDERRWERGEQKLIGA